MKTLHNSHRPRRAAALLLGPALLLAVMATPASAGTTLVSGFSVFNTQCQAPVGGVPAGSSEAFGVFREGAEHDTRGGA